MKAEVFLVLVLVLLLRSVTESMAGPSEGEMGAIGLATMEEDGTIVLQLRAEGAGGELGDALLRYAPGHPQYEGILKHLGGLERGQSKPVPPWMNQGTLKQPGQ